jgi:serine/threonine protein phosphatase PrpC
MSYRWWSCCRTDTGRHRRVNEDAYLNLDDIGLWIVADGMGGHFRGDLASRMIVDAFSDLARPQTIDEFAVLARERLRHANAAICHEVLDAHTGQIMGSTVVIFLVYNHEWLCLWAGDSRAYLLRDGQLIQITHDHSVVQEMVDSGKLRKAEAVNHPAAHKITRAIGTRSNLQLDEHRSFLRDGDTVLLCSDGLNREVEDQELAEILDNYDCEEASRELVDLTLERGARDNVTVAVIKFEATTAFRNRIVDHTPVNYQLTGQWSQHVSVPSMDKLSTLGNTGQVRV